jgi:hypothetical protein
MCVCACAYRPARVRLFVRPHGPPLVCVGCSFGHSATQAALLTAEAGMDSVWFMRIDIQDAARRLADKEMQFVWRASPSLGPSTQVGAPLICVPTAGPPARDRAYVLGSVGARARA